MPPRRAAPRAPVITTLGGAAKVPQQVQAQQSGAKVAQFDRGLLGRWLHMLLVAFYSDEEAVVAELLYRRAAMIRDTGIAKSLGLPDRQVRQALERRLVPDSVVERITEGVPPYTQTFYRICPAVIAVAAQRLQALEDTLGRVTEDEYFCPKCRRTYDSLQAMSLTRSKEANGGGGFAFLCEECDEELSMTAETARAQHDRLQRFRVQCRDLLLLTRELKEMPVPQFPREAKEPRSLQPPAQLEGPGGGPAGAATAAAAAGAQAASQKGPGGAAGAGQAAAVPGRKPLPMEDWLHREICCCEPLAAVGSAAEASAPPPEEGEALLQEAMEQARGRLQEERLERLSKGLAGRAEDVRRRAAEGQTGGEAHRGPTVTVQGQPYALWRVRDDDDLMEAMTDAEYQRFVDLDRQTHGLAVTCSISQ
mmetsp:Transcript_100492/g.304934  ORF Transcript_100492/g.304934 Transcript_100492/m.304934 type:complete len:422 (-) Transcript_100492:175-1440(-)